jgi:hypothetical protein
MRGDKSGAHVGEIASEGPSGPQCASIANAAGENDWSCEETSDGARESEWVQATCLAACARRQQHQTVGPGLDRPLGMTDARDIGEDQCSRVVQWGKDGAWRYYARDDEFGSMLEHNLQIIREPGVRAVHD